MDRILKRPVSRRGVLAAAAVAGVGVAAARFIDLESIHRALAGKAPVGPWPNALAQESGRVAHLLRRAGFGYSAAEFESALHLGFKGLVEQLLHPTPVSVTPPADLINLGTLRNWWMTQMVTSKNPLQEKMTLFWHGFLTSDYRKAGNKQPHMYRQNVLFRESGLGNFRTLLQGISRNPAMMLYLDLQTSRKGAPNENYSRELMELFTMGPGNYTELDVREGARALTGWAIRADTSYFNPQQYDNSSKTFLGRTGNFGMDEILDIILAQKATAPFVAAKFARYFVMPAPPADYVRRLADTLVKSKWDVRTLLRAIFESPEFVSPAAYRALIKSPAEYVASTLRAVGGDNALIPPAINRMQAMDQGLFDPPTVAGWPSDGGWITSNTLLGRLNFAQDVVTRVKPLPNDRSTAERQLDQSLSPNTGKVLAKLQGGDHWYAALASTEFQLK
jgi:uncharacterized protein (DUF1800 family)